MTTMTKTRHIPLRRCVLCGAQAPKGALVRLVRTPPRSGRPGQVLLDRSGMTGLPQTERGKTAGRGAYLCRSASCWDALVKTDRLGAVLKHPLSPAERLRLREEFGGLLRGEAPTGSST